MKALISFAVLSALMSCGPAPELKRLTLQTTTDKSIEAAALTGKTDEEIIKMKYAGSVPLNCEFKIMEGSNVDLDKIVGWKQTLEASTRETQYEPIVFKLNGDRKISIQVLIESFQIDRPVKTEIIEGNLYEMSFSPSAMITVKLTESANGSVKSVKTIQKKIIEQVSERIEGFVLSPDISEELRCSLTPTIKEPYSKQWKLKGRKEVVSPAPEAASEPAPVTPDQR